MTDSGSLYNHGCLCLSVSLQVGVGFGLCGGLCDGEGLRVSPERSWCYSVDGSGKVWWDALCGYVCVCVSVCDHGVLDVLPQRGRVRIFVRLSLPVCLWDSLA